MSLINLAGILLLVNGGFTRDPSDLANSVKFDPKCIGGVTLNSLRVTSVDSSCTSFPCIIKRGKEYTVYGEFISEKDMPTLNVKCGTVYLGRQITFSDYGGCDSLTNGTSCPIKANVINYSKNTFTVPLFVPPIVYNLWCRVTDDSGQKLVCGSGSGRVV